MSPNQRPDHPDFWLISQVMISLDAVAESNAIAFDDHVAQAVDPDSLMYTARQQVAMMLDRMFPRQILIARSDVRTAAEAAFGAGFMAGVRFQNLKEHGMAVPDSPEGLE